MSEAESKLIFQRKLNALMEERHINQKEVAAICEVSTSTVSTWSQGINMPRMDKIERLANHFDLPKSYFIEDSPALHIMPVFPTEEDIKFALFGGDGEITDDMYKEVKNFAAYVKSREQEKKKE